jgi:DNA polymerase III subunit gamma/tau
MEKFVVSARKYRPATFDTVVGQSHITTTLKNAIRTNHLAQAFLFCGPRGVGKTTCARILAKTINCERLGDDVEPCNECESCKSFNHSASFNIHELDAASNNSVEDIRNLIDQVRFPPQHGKYKIYIIDEVHMLSQAAFNAFLKTLEEPPSYAIFILATTEKHKILPTILSRCQIFDFNRIQIKDMAEHLANIAQKESISADYQALELIAQKADGGLRDALSMFDLNVTFSAGQGLTYQAVLENLHILDYDYYFKMTDALSKSDISSAYLIYNEILEKGFDGHQFVVGLNEHFRNLLVCKDPATVKLLQVSDSVQKKYLEQSASMNLGYLMSSLSVGSQLDIQYKAAKHQRLHVEIGLLKLSQIQQVLHLSQLPNGGSNSSSNANPTAVIVEEKKNDNQVIAATPIPSVVNETSQIPANSYTTSTTISAPQTAPINRSSSRLKSTLDLEVAPINTKNETTQVIDSQGVVSGLNKNYSIDELQEVWNIFIESRNNANEQVTLRRAFELVEHTIHLKLDNQLQMDLFVEMKQDLAIYLRQNLQNSSIQLSAEVLANNQEKRPYSAQEKFEFMAKKNPALWDLKEKLNLDLMF